MNEQEYAAWEAQNADILDVAPDRGSFDYRERAFFVDQTERRIADATAALARDPYDRAAQQALNTATHLLPTLKKSMESHPDHAAVEHKRQVKAAIAQGVSDGIQADRLNQAAALDSSLQEAYRQAKQSGNTALAESLAALIKGSQR